jgi:hypothetical protein
MFDVCYSMFGRKYRTSNNETQTSETQTPKLSSEDDFFLNENRTLEAIIAKAINEIVRIVYEFRTRE